MSASERGSWHEQCVADLTPRRNGIHVGWRSSKPADQRQAVTTLARAGGLAADDCLLPLLRGWQTRTGQDDPSGELFHLHEAEPGVVGQIFRELPLLMAGVEAGPALQTFTVVMKPAQQTPLTALRVGELMLRRASRSV